MINSAPKASKPIDKDGFFTKVWLIWFDNLRRFVNQDVSSGSAPEFGDVTIDSREVLRYMYTVSAGSN